MIECPYSGCGYAGRSQEELDEHVTQMDARGLHEAQISDNPKPFCIGCIKTPDEIYEYSQDATESSLSPDEYVKREEGTYNSKNGHFLCTACYIKAGQPSSSSGWVAP